MTSCHNDDRAVAVDAGTPRIALIGSPNAGKTSVFNHLTGLHAKTGNYPGVTVSRGTGTAKCGDGSVIAVEDFPGTYSLTPISPDEKVVSDHLLGNLAGYERPDAIVLVADATTLRRSMSLVAQVVDLGLPTLLSLTMGDELAARGGHINIEQLSSALGLPVVPVIGHKGQGVDNLREHLAHYRTWPQPLVTPPTDDAELQPWIDSVLSSADYKAARSDSLTEKIDRILLHPLLGTLIFFVVMFLFFQVIFTIATPIQDWLGDQITALGSFISSHIGNSFLKGFVSSGIFGGVGTVLTFIPQIALLFFLIGLLENIGYMSRAAFLTDRIMAKTGLEGRAFVAMLSSFACAIPGIMASRTIPSAKDRIATIITAPLMTCSARLPVFTLLVGLLVSSDTRVGIFNAQGVVMFALYFAGGFSALICAAIFKKTILRSDLLPFSMELPPYRFPGAKAVLLEMWNASKIFIKKAGTIILFTSVILWGLLNLPLRSSETAHMDDTQATAYVMDNSYAAKVGKFIEPVFAPMGFDWRTDIALLGAVSAREVFVSTLGQVAAAEDPDDPHDALRKLTYTHGSDKGQRVFTTATTVALLVYFIYALQCMSTIAIMRRETNSWKWPAVAFGYMFVLAWVMAFLAFRITSLIVG